MKGRLLMWLAPLLIDGAVRLISAIRGRPTVEPPQFKQTVIDRGSYTNMENKVLKRYFRRRVSLLPPKSPDTKYFHYEVLWNDTRETEGPFRVSNTAKIEITVDGTEGRSCEIIGWYEDTTGNLSERVHSPEIVFADTLPPEPPEYVSKIEDLGETPSIY